MIAKTTWIASSESEAWVDRSVDARPADAPANVRVEGILRPGFKGFGGCFNELGWRALSRLAPDAREAALDAFFGADGCRFTYCRLPMGANDFAESWYSYDETPGDFALKDFSIERDRRAILPFLKAARKAAGRDFFLFASPWSPPTWVKRPQAYNYGRLIWDEAHRKAYAEYFVRYVRAYAAEGLRIDSVHVQNEPDSDQKFPSHKMSGERMRDFIRDDLGPAFTAAGLDTQIWAGTLERADYDAWAGTILADPKAAGFVKGLGFQWAGKGAIQRARLAHPERGMIQTECECGDGANTWAYAQYVFDLVHHYLTNGAEAFVYWNFALDDGGESTWGWRQNSLVTVDPETGAARFTPEFHVMKHFARFAGDGCSVLRLAGEWAANAVGFRAAGGETILVARNPQASARDLVVEGRIAFRLAPTSVNTITLTP